MAATTVARETQASRSAGGRAALPLDVPTPVTLDATGRRFLLRLARVVVAVAAAEPGASDRLEAILAELPPDALAELAEPAAAFVTLHRASELRGCVGSLVPGRPVWRSVISAAASAADDPRFEPLAAAEVAELRIDVSVLGPAVPLEDPRDFVAGEHGLIVERGLHAALMLPEVAPEYGWGAAEMLEATSHKAGLPPDAWHDPATRLRVFRTTRFGDGDVPEPGAPPSSGPQLVARS
jgi:AmmeMemoRadiSam system protein A